MTLFEKCHNHRTSYGPRILDEVRAAPGTTTDTEVSGEGATKRDGSRREGGGSHWFGVLGLLPFLMVMAACSAPPVPSGVDDDDTDAEPVTKKKATTASPSNDTPVVEAPLPSTTTIPTSQCSATSGDACFDCCNTASGGALAPADAIFGECACGVSGQCTAVCDTNLCSGLGRTTACDTCLRNTCDQAENAACTSAACKAGLACFKQCT